MAEGEVPGPKGVVRVRGIWRFSSVGHAPTLALFWGTFQGVLTLLSCLWAPIQRTCWTLTRPPHRVTMTGVLVVGPLLHHCAIGRRRVLESLQIGEGFRLAMQCHMLGGGGAFGNGLGQEVELLIEDVGGLDDGRRQSQVACLG